MFVFESDELVPKGYTNLDFQFDKYSRWSTFSFVFTFGGVTVRRISVLKNLRRKSACNQYPMPLQWVVLCM